MFNIERSGIVFDANDVTVRGCTIHDVAIGSGAGRGHGIYATNGADEPVNALPSDPGYGDGCDNATVENNVIYRSFNLGNGINYKCGRGVIRNNIIYDAEDGIHLEDQDPWLPVGVVEVYGNRVFNNNGGIVVYNYHWNDGVGVNIHNNTTYKNGKWQNRDEPREMDLQVNVKAGVTVRDNIFYTEQCSAADHDCYDFRMVWQGSNLDPYRNLTSDNNCYYHEFSTLTFQVLSEPKIYTLSSWQAATAAAGAPQDVGSVFAKPLFKSINPTSSDFLKLTPGSACAGKGAQ